MGLLNIPSIFSNQLIKQPLPRVKLFQTRCWIHMLGHLIQPVAPKLILPKLLQITNIRVNNLPLWQILSKTTKYPLHTSTIVQVTIEPHKKNSNTHITEIIKQSHHTDYVLPLSHINRTPPRGIIQSKHDLFKNIHQRHMQQKNLHTITIPQ